MHMIAQEGQHKDYSWIVMPYSGKFRGLGSIIKELPQTVLDVTILIPVFDGETLELGPEQEEKGWELLGNCAKILPLEKAEDLPLAPHSEYYLFTQDPKHIPAESFVEDIFFYPSEDNHEFWTAVEKQNPETVIIEKDATFVASKNAKLILALKQRFSG